jgi:hypothetical protein
MSSLSAKDRVSLCQFTFADGRRCRTPRTGKNPHFCFDHAQKEARAHAVESLSKDLSYFFSGDYLSACDLSTALGLLLPAVIRGDVKPRTARTVAYLAQTLLQTIRMSQHEYCEAFDPDDWRESIRNSVNGNYNHNHDHRFPPVPKSEQPESPQPQSVETPVNCHSERSEESAFSESRPGYSSLATHHSPLPQAPQPAPSPHTPLPPTGAEFAQQVLAGQNSSRPPRATQRSSREPGSATANPNHASPSAATHFPATGSQPTPSSPLPTARPAASPIQSSTDARHSPQQPLPPEPHPPVAAAPPRQEPRPAAGLHTGPSGLPVLAPLPPRKPEAPAGSRSS